MKNRFQRKARKGWNDASKIKTQPNPSFRKAVREAFFRHVFGIEYRKGMDQGLFPPQFILHGKAIIFTPLLLVLITGGIVWSVL